MTVPRFKCGPSADCSYGRALSVVLLAFSSCTAWAADVTNYLWIGFDGRIAGTTYSLATGERDLTNSFAVSGSATTAAGFASVPGSTDQSSGFYFSAASLGSLTSSSWLAEVRFQPSAGASSQPGVFNHLIDVQGDTYLRYNNYDYSTKRFEAGFYDGEEHRQSMASPSTTQSSHWVLAWDAASHSLSTYRDGELVVSQSGSEFATPSSSVGFGFFARPGFFDRAVDGILDAVAFSTFQGQLDPAEDFQLNHES